MRTTIVGFAIGDSDELPAKNAIVSDLPQPCVCQITPPRRSPSSAAASVVTLTAMAGTGRQTYAVSAFQLAAGAAFHRWIEVPLGRLLQSSSTAASATQRA